MSLKFNTYVKSVSVVNNNIEKLVFNIILWSFGVLILSYVFILGNMVKDIIERQGLEVRATALSNEVRNLEVTYLSMSNEIDIVLSSSMGFKETQATFATRKAIGFLPSGNSFGNVKTAQNEI